MGFHFIEGLMGGGKSYHGAELCYTCLEEGGVVHTNMPLNMEVVAQKGWTDRVVILTGEPGDWVKKTVKEGRKKIWTSDVFQMGREGAENVVVVDEAAIEVSADDQQDDKKKNQALFGLVALSRHAGLDIYFLAQRRNAVAKKVRDLAETTTWCTNVGNIPVFGWLLKRWGDLRRSVYKDGEFYGSCYVKIKPEIGGFYFTHGMRDQLEMKSGGQRVKKASAWTRKGILFLGGGSLLCIACMAWSMFGVWGIYKKKTEAKEKPNEAQAETKTVDRISSDGSKKEIVVPVKPPAPKGGILLEWDAYDEHVLSAVIRSKGQRQIVTRGGRRLFLGGNYEGQKIDLQFEVAGWHYFVCQNKRVVVVRPLRPEEREALPPLTIPGPPGQTKDLLQTSPADGILATLHNPLQ